MDFKHHIERAWELTIAHIVALLLVTLVMVAVSSLTLGILAPVTMAGYTQSLLLLLRSGREPRVQDLFAHMHLFFPLLGFSLAVLLAMTLGFALFLLPGVLVLAAVAFACLYVLPLMTDRRMALFEAIGESWRLAQQGRLADHLVAVVIVTAISAVGGTVYVGTLFTQPLATLFLLSIYEEKTGGPRPRPFAPIV